MADTKTTALTEITAPVSTDLVYVVGDPGTTPVSRKATLATIRKTLMVDGWIEAGETWTYASAITFTISGDKTTKYSAGMRLKLTDVTVKYFIITAVSYGAPNTTVTVYGGTDYSLSGGAITLPYYSMSKAPFGFPLDPSKWTVTTTDTSSRAQNTPVQNTWYNPGTLTIAIPIGAWYVSYQAAVYGTKATAWDVFITLSTANNSESDAQFTATCYVNVDTELTTTVHRRKVLVLAVAATYYLNVRTKTASVGAIAIDGASSQTIIQAVCAYL